MTDFTSNEMKEIQESADHIGFMGTIELTDKIYEAIKDQHPSLHRDACYRVVEEVLDRLKIPPPKDEVIIRLLMDGDECKRFVASSHTLNSKILISDNLVFSGPQHVMENIWSYYHVEHTLIYK